MNSSKNFEKTHVLIPRHIINDLIPFLLNKDFDGAFEKFEREIKFLFPSLSLAIQKNICHQLNTYLYFLFTSSLGVNFPEVKEGNNILIAGCETKFDYEETRLVLLANYSSMFQGKCFGCKNRHVSFALDYIHKNLSKPLTLDMVSRTIYLNKCYLSQTFKNATGYNLTDYVNLCRVERAKMLLATTEDSIDYVAQACGFNSPSYFSYVFRKIARCSPTAYRKKILKELQSSPIDQISS